MKNILKVTLILLLPLLGYSQEGVRFTDKFGPFQETYQIDNDFSNRKFAPYPYVREADVMWSKVTWEIIDLREKMNLNLYYPTDTLQNRKSFIFAVLGGLKDNLYSAYKTPIQQNAFEFDPDNMYMDYQDILDINKRDELVPIEISPGVTRDSLVTVRWRPDEIKQILVKEVWYFSKKDSRLHREIIGLCPIREYTYQGVQRKQRLFWVYYPDLRPYFATVPVYNPFNDTPDYTYDDLFVHGYFRSYFVQEANVYNDRAITDYVTGKEAQLESQRIKQEIFDDEQDMWEN